MSKKTQTVKIFGKKNKMVSKIEMPANARVIQISWSPLGDVDEVSFQFGGDGTEEIEIHEGEADTERIVGFTVRPDLIEDDGEEYEDEGDDE